MMQYEYDCNGNEDDLWMLLTEMDFEAHIENDDCGDVGNGDGDDDGNVDDSHEYIDDDEDDDDDDDDDGYD